MLELLLDSGASIDLVTSYQETALHLAILEQRTEAVAELLRRGASIASRGSGNKSPLHYAAEANSAPIIALLLQHRAGINDAGADDRRTPLHAAAAAGAVAAITALLAAGADATVRDGHGRTASQLAPTDAVRAAFAGAAGSSAPHSRPSPAARRPQRSSGGPDYYAILGVARTANDEQLRRAYKEMAIRVRGRCGRRSPLRATIGSLRRVGTSVSPGQEPRADGDVSHGQQGLPGVARPAEARSVRCQRRDGG